MVIVVEDLDGFKKLMKEAGNKLVVVDFTAAWCGPCQRIGPVFKSLSEDPANANVIFVKVDVDDAQDVAASCEIKAMPTFHFYKNNKKLDEFTGADIDKLKAKLEELR